MTEIAAGTHEQLPIGLSTRLSRLLALAGALMSRAADATEAQALWGAGAGPQVGIDGETAGPTPPAEAETARTLAEVRPGHRALVVRVGGDRVLRRRLVDLGLTAGTEVSVLRIAPLGDPLEILVKGTHLSLRRREASTIEVRAPA